MELSIADEGVIVTRVGTGVTVTGGVGSGGSDGFVGLSLPQVDSNGKLMASNTVSARRLRPQRWKVCFDIYKVPVESLMFLSILG